eukprot:TRINITY_DN7887_c0_g1_i3.p1 TRINITY_DN7887_c0_g1~~TRINITY_DN7887_c0_g1_i3.p1  ORF type:complete len:674 (+),score=97.27 TRINITY_DN7887_c0_g1_i3:81-2102(+)
MLSCQLLRAFVTLQLVTSTPDSRSCSLLQGFKNQVAVSVTFEEEAQSVPDQAVHEQATTLGISIQGNITRRPVSKRLSKDCAILVVLGQRAQTTLKRNIENFRDRCDLLLASYDSSTLPSSDRAWYRNVSVLTAEKPYFNKLEFLFDLLENYQEVIESYQALFLMDDDISLHTLDFPQFVDFGLSSHYNLLVPTVWGRIAQLTQKPGHCPVLQTDAMDFMAVLVKVSMLGRFANLVLQESVDDNGRIPCDWGFPRFACRGLDDNTGTGCAVADHFGSVLHADQKSQVSVQHHAPTTGTGFCSDGNTGFSMIKEYYFRLGEFYGERRQEVCFSLDINKESGGHKFELQPSSDWIPVVNSSAKIIMEARAIERLCHERIGSAAGLSEFGSPGAPLQADAIYHVHIPKVAGTSFKHDAAQILGSNLISEEVCMYSYPKGAKTAILLREPRSHVMSQYFFCRDSDEDGPKIMNSVLPQNFSRWVNHWTRMMSHGKNKVNFQKGAKTIWNSPWCSSRLPYGCYSPINLQSHRLTCREEYDYSEEPLLQAAKHSVAGAYFLGIQEAYQESLCLLHAQVKNKLPSWCNCSDENAWDYGASNAITRATHRSAESSSHSWEQELNTEMVAKVDALTFHDRALYREGVKRFLRDIQAVEERFVAKILCDDKAEELRKAASMGV